MMIFSSLNEKLKRSQLITVGIAGGIAVIMIMIIGTVIMGSAAHNDTERAIHSVSTLYLDELAGRREQVVANNLQSGIKNLKVALSLMTEDDLSDQEHLQAFQARMKNSIRWIDLPLWTEMESFIHLWGIRPI